MSKTTGALAPDGRCGCAHSGWFHEGPTCDLPADHPDDHGSPNRSCPGARFQWARVHLHPRPCGCRLCSPGRGPDLATVARIIEAAGEGAFVLDHPGGGFQVLVERGGRLRRLARAGTVELLEAALRRAVAPC